MSFNRAVIDYASRNREHLLFNIYRMGQRAIARGSDDTWTPSPSRINAAGEKMGGGRGAGPEASAAAWAELRTPELRDPRGYIIPSNQADFRTATKFVNALREVNVAVHRATAAFAVGGKTYPAGSFVVMTAQAFRPHVLDMFEPQDHPNVIPYPGAPPTPPYDAAGWTLAFQMGIEFDRILEPFTGPFEKVTEWNVPLPRWGIGTATTSSVDRRVNDSFTAVNRLLKAGAAVFATPTSFTTSAEGATPLRTPRIGLWDQYGGSMPSGWTRWILEQFEFPFSRVFAQELDAGHLNAKYDVLIFVDGAIPAAGGGGRGGRGGGAGPDPQDVPAEYRAHLGRVTPERTIPELRQFVEAGGTVIAIGDSAANIATHLQLPIDNHLVENGSPLPRAKYFVPRSVLTAKVDTTHPIAFGMRERTDFFFDNSPVFKLRAGDTTIRAIAAFDNPTPLHSGWAWGQQYLNGGVIAAEASLGKGKVLLFGPEILQRAQPHGTFKMLFNGIFSSVEERR
jgi:hypothetical protein